MKKMYYGSAVCEVSVSDQFLFLSQVPCHYEKDVLAYAAKRYFANCKELCRECTNQSLQYRLATGKEERQHDFTNVAPAALMELPGKWVRVSGEINSVGVVIRKIELLKERPKMEVRSREKEPAVKNGRNESDRKRNQRQKCTVWRAEDVH